MEEMIKLLDELEGEVRKLKPETAQKGSALNGIAHVRDNLKGHFAVKVPEEKPAEKPKAKG